MAIHANSQLALLAFFSPIWYQIPVTVVMVGGLIVALIGGFSLVGNLLKAIAGGKPDGFTEFVQCIVGTYFGLLAAFAVLATGMSLYELWKHY